MAYEVDGEQEAAVEYLGRWSEWVRTESAIRPLHGTNWRSRQPEPPVSALQAAALSHPNPRIRRECLSVLDHEANEASAQVFRAALGDPIPRVRLAALHGLACERCRSSDLCVSEVAPVLITVATDDPSPKVRHETVSILLRLSDRDRRAGAALGTVADDPDPLVRAVALAALEGRSRDVRSRRALRRRSRST